jgi:hypothetical protein
MIEIAPDLFKSNNGVFILVAVISAVFSLLLTVIWMIIGWRAMKAHEKIASDLSKLVDSSRKTELPASTLPSTIPSATIPQANQPNQPDSFRQQNNEQNKLYRHFLVEDAEAAKLPLKERHEKFRQWKIKNGFES